MGMLGAGATLAKNSSPIPVLSIEAPTEKLEAHDVTALSASAKQKLPGMPDSGELKWTQLYDDDSYEAWCSAKGVADDFLITFPDGLTAGFSAFITEIKIDLKPDDPAILEVTAAVDGAIEITNPS